MNRDDAQKILETAVGDGSHEFGSFFLSRLFGMKVAYEDESCIVSFEVEPFLYNPQGSLHGGVLATALDISMGHLLKQHFVLKKGREIFFLQSLAQHSSGVIAAAKATPGPFPL